MKVEQQYCTVLYVRTVMYVLNCPYEECSKHVDTHTAYVDTFLIILLYVSTSTTTLV